MKFIFTIIALAISANAFAATASDNLIIQFHGEVYSWIIQH